jgi:hypothetical protein
VEPPRVLCLPFANGKRVYHVCGNSFLIRTTFSAALCSCTTPAIRTDSPDCIPLPTDSIVRCEGFSSQKSNMVRFI